MESDDLRYYETFYAIHQNKFPVNFGTFSNHKKILVKEYLNMACETTDYTGADEVNDFLYPHHIKKIYHIEGVIAGQITLAAQGAEATATRYKVSIWKMHGVSMDATELFTTGWITINDTLTWDAGNSIGQERVYAFWIDAWEKETLTEYERIFLRVEVDCDSDTVLWHSNDATWEDIKIEIPFRL